MVDQETTDEHSSENRREEASEAERDDEYHAVIETDPILDEVAEANKKAGRTGEPRRVVPSKPC